MHYLTYLIVPTEEIKNEEGLELEDQLHPFMAKTEGELWDWWQIGGRWSGHLSGYDPEKDPANIEVCSYCETPDHKRLFEGKLINCNGCNGTGKSTKWPTGWGVHEGDVQPVGILMEKDEPPHYLIMPCAWLEFDSWIVNEKERIKIKKKHKKQFKEVIRPYMNGEFAVVVLDLHN